MENTVVISGLQKINQLCPLIDVSEIDVVQVSFVFASLRDVWGLQLLFIS